MFYNASSFSNLIQEITTICNHALRNNSRSVVMPTFDKQLVIDILTSMRNLFIQEQPLLVLDGDFLVIGNLHGHVFDLIRVLNQYGLPPKMHYIFLGNLIDRGAFSFETLLVVFCMKLLYPKSISILRGNNEFDEMCRQFGFYDEILSMYHEKSIYTLILEIFSMTPIAALLNHEYLAVHGGIGPNLRNISDISKICFPLTNLYGGIPDEIVWSEPSNDVDLFMESETGNGYLFGRGAAKQFLDDNKLKGLIVGYSSGSDGQLQSFDGLVYPVHTASNGNSVKNLSGVLYIKHHMMPQPVISPSIRSVCRKNSMNTTVIKIDLVQSLRGKTYPSSVSSNCLRNKMIPISCPKVPDRQTLLKKIKFG